MPYVILNGHIPQTLGDEVEFSFKLGEAIGFGVVFYMLDAQQGGRGYTINLNNVQGPLFSTPPVRLYTTLCTTLGPPLGVLKMNTTNTLQFKSVGDGPPINLLHVVLQYVEPGIG